MPRILKYLLDSDYSRDIRCSQVLSVIEQYGQIVVYVIDDTAKNKTFRFEIRGTGKSILIHTHQFLGTVKCGEYVWHVFYREVK